MQQKPTHTRPAPAPGPCTPPRAPAKFAAAALAVILAAFQLAGCARRDPVEGLGELPGTEAAKLRPVPNLPLLATQVKPRPPPPPAPTSPAALCPKDWTYTFFDAQVAIPVTRCTRAEARAGRESEPPPTGPGTSTHKLTDPRVFEGLQDLTILQPPLVCTTNSGPWPARLTVERACIGTCRPVNNLVVFAVPNDIQFVWVGGFDDHPPGFEFVGRPTETETFNFGECNAGPVPPSGVQPPSR